MSAPIALPPDHPDYALAVASQELHAMAGQPGSAIDASRLVSTIAATEAVSLFGLMVKAEARAVVRGGKMGADFARVAAMGAMLERSIMADLAGMALAFHASGGDAA